MSRYAILSGSDVVNVALADAPLASNWVPLADDSPVGPGWTYDGSTFAPPPEPEPVPPTKEQQQANRFAAYTSEADPLFFKWQAGEGTEADWLAKREEIRARYPYPDEE